VLPEVDEKAAARFAKRWNFIPMRFSPGAGFIDLLQFFATPALTVQLHYIKRPDPTYLYHDHPWSFLSLIVKGSYTEKIMRDPYDTNSYEVKHRPRFSLHRMKNSWAHNIFESEEGTVTLFVFGRWVREGFRFYQDGKDVDMSRFSAIPGDGSGMMKIR
jgi:hypothetical protein